MSEVKSLPIWNEYETIKQYYISNELFERVKKNELFYRGKQWEGVKAGNLPKPVFNIIQRCVKYLIATLSSNDVSISLNVFSNNPDDQMKMQPIIKEIENVIEQSKTKEKSRLAIRDAAISGAAYLFQTFNPDFDTKQPLKGRIENTLLDITDVYFGNPYSNEIQTQPYIIIALRQPIELVKKEAKALGLEQSLIDQIQPDDAPEEYTEEYGHEDKNCTVLIKLFKKENQEGKDTVHFTKCTRLVTLRNEQDLGTTRYPLAGFGWEPIRHSCLYDSPITPVIPNQIFINKTYAIAQMYGQQSCFPKTAFDINKISAEDLLDETNTTMAVANLDIMGKVVDFIKIPDFSTQILGLIERTQADTKDCLGVNDASLGNVNPDNTSAIMALQQGSNVPLELQRQTYNDMWEEMVRNIIDLMGATYGAREVLLDNQVALVDFSILNELRYELSVDIGSGAQYSEIAQIQTLDKLLTAGLISPEVYVEIMPDKYLMGKQRILESIKEQIAMQQQAQAQAAATQQEQII